MKYFKKISSFILINIVFPANIAFAAPTATEIVDRSENVLWGKTMQGDMDMVIVTPTWTKTLSVKMWIDRPTRSFARIVGPAKEAGMSSLRIGAEMWNYIPNIERTIKIPPSLMLQPWFGSDFANDDMVKEGSYIIDYTHKLIGELNVDGQEVYEVEGLPKPNAPVVWGKVIFTIRKKDFIPVKYTYYDERGEALRVFSFSDIRTLSGRNIPMRWEMKPLNKPGKSSTIIIKSGVYNEPINQDLFSLRNLTKKD